MQQVSVPHRAALAPLFAGQTDTLILSCLQGEMGAAWADREEAPACARMIVGDICFFGGDSAAPEAAALARELPKEHPSGFLLVLSPDEGWQSLLYQAHAGRCRKLTRYGFFHDASGLEPERLRRNLELLPAGYALEPIGRRLYPALTREDWSRDFCSQFHDEEDYVRRGLGFAVTRQGRPVCGASSYTVYHGGIEIEIGTRADCRRQGLATVCASRLILECLDRGLYPSWDAANPVSKALALKLGYRFRGEYPTIRVELNG